MHYIPVRDPRSPQGFVSAIVSAEDHPYLSQFHWHLSGGKGTTGGKYAARQPSGKTVYMHREIAGRMGLIAEASGSIGGRWTVSVDHDNGDKLDNRRPNLALKNRSRQMRNGKDALRSTNTSGHRGVSFDTARKKWVASATLDYKTINLGRFPTFEDAVASRERWDAAQGEG